MVLGTALPGVLATVTATKIHAVLPPVPRVLPKNPETMRVWLWHMADRNTIKPDVRCSFAFVTCLNGTFSSLRLHGICVKSFQGKM